MAFATRCLAVFVGLLAILIGTIVYNVYLPFSPALWEDSMVMPIVLNTAYFFSSIGEKLGIAPRHKIIHFLLSFSDWSRLGHFEDATISGVPVRIYRPKKPKNGLPKAQMRPALIYFHGGGLVLCKARSNTFDKICATLAEGTKSVVISVEYRLAPKHKFPAAFQDSHSVVTTVMNEAKKFGIMRDKIALGGDSAGGLLAAAVSLQLAKENKSKDIAAQLLIYPWLQSIDMTCLPSYQKYSDGFFLSREMMAFFLANVVTGKSDFEEVILSGNVSRYFMDTPYWKFLEIQAGSKCRVPSEKPVPSVPFEFVKAVQDPRLSPLLTDSVNGSPPTFIATAEYDVFANEGRLFARRLEKAGVSVIQKIYTTYHGFIMNIVHPFTTTPMTMQGMQDMVNYLNSVFYET